MKLRNRDKRRNSMGRLAAMLALAAVSAAVVLYFAGAYDISFIERPGKNNTVISDTEAPETTAKAPIVNQTGSSISNISSREDLVGSADSNGAAKEEQQMAISEFASFASFPELDMISLKTISSGAARLSPPQALKTICPNISIC